MGDAMREDYREKGGKVLKMRNQMSNRMVPTSIAWMESIASMCTWGNNDHVSSQQEGLEGTVKWISAHSLPEMANIAPPD
jgi:hypothetical protein